jgi:alkylated DNA repair dioxygenase AlkB
MDPQLVRYIPNFINQTKANELCSILQAIIPWSIFPPSPKSRKVYMWNQFMESSTDPNINKIFRKLIKGIKQLFNADVQGIFCNLYENGGDYCPYHKDRYNMNIYTLSLGATRDFLIKPDGKGTKSQKYTLHSGDMYFMHDALHQTHKHSIPKRKTCTDTRISIVFFT